MSIFKAREYWSNAPAVGHDRGKDAIGVLNAGCLAVDRISSWPESDCVLLADGTELRVYKPEGEYRAAHLLLEARLDDYVLQVDTGKFMSASNDTQVLVLHPLKYIVYSLQRQEGHTDIGDQNKLTPVLNHTLMRKACNLVHGHFGNTKSRELVCVQSLDGTFSFFDQEVALFFCSFSDIVLPGPFGYIKSCDSFVIYKTNWILEIYSYLQMSELGSSLQRQVNKKSVPQWMYNPGEEIYSLQVIQTSNNFSSIIALGERYLYCLQDNGLLKFMKKFDFMPMCFHAYLIGWYYEPNARLLIMVASEDSKLLIYEKTTLLWACELFFTPIEISRCFLKGLPGGIVMLSEDGIVNCCYLGTEPDLSGSVPFIQGDSASPESVQKELEEVEEILKNITENEENEDDTSIQEIVKVSITLSECLKCLHEDAYNSIDTIDLVQCPVSVKLTFKDPLDIQSVQISYFCTPPFVCSENVKSLDKVNGVEFVETQVFVAGEADVSDFNLKVLVTLTDGVGKIRTMTEEVLLPLKLFCDASPAVEELKFKLKINTNITDVHLYELFSEFSKEDIHVQGASTSITLMYKATKAVVSVTSTKQQYCIQSNHYARMTAVVEYLITKLRTHTAKNGNDVALIWLGGKFNLEILQSFMKCIEVHASERVRLQKHEEELSVLQSQFTLIQRKLLVQYGSLPPGDCDALEFLMKDTYQRISNNVQALLQGKEDVHRAGCALVAVGHLVVLVFELMNSEKTKTDLLKEAFSLQSLYDDNQSWEETVSQSVSHILPVLYGKSEKDKERLAPVTEQGILNPINLKRFMKQIRTLLERMLGEVKDNFQDDTPEAYERKLPSGPERVEEFVEVV